MAEDSSYSADAEFRSLDGLLLRGTLVVPPAMSGAPAVLVHGGGVTREEGGFFTRLASGLAEAGIPSLRFDLRGHGQSEGRQEDLTISGIVNDIRSAAEYISAKTGSRRSSRARAPAAAPLPPEPAPANATVPLERPPQA